jgi:hypothetical protein
LSGEIGPLGRGRGVCCAAACPRPGALGIPIAAPDSTANDCLRFMMFRCFACDGESCGRLAPIKVNARKEAVSLLNPHSRAIVHQASTLSRAFRSCIEVGCEQRHRGRAELAQLVLPGGCHCAESVQGARRFEPGTEPSGIIIHTGLIFSTGWLVGPAGLEPATNGL